MASSLPDPKRYITSNNEKTGTSEFSKQIPESLSNKSDLGGAFARLAYSTDQTPSDLSGHSDLKAYETTYEGAAREMQPLLKPKGGTNVWYIDTPPDSESPMHRTVSIDFVIMISGEIELSQADGEVRIVKPGDMVIQRSTMHQWRNVSKTEWARMAAVMVSCEPFRLSDGTELGPYFPSH